MSQRGYTIIELMMALTVLAIGVSGIIAMQKITVTTNQHAKNLALATHIAQAWQEQLALDAASWNHPSPQNGASDLPQTRWLNNVGLGTWFRPSHDATVMFGAGFDALGNVVTDADFEQAAFCTHIRLTWLYPQTNGNGLIRSEVRVFWPRSSMGGTVDGRPVCDPDTDPTAVTSGSERYHFVYQTTAIKQNTAQ